MKTVLQTIVLFIAQLSIAQPASLDLTFNKGVGPDSIVRKVSIQADGKIVIAGSFTHFDNVPYTGIARLNQDGTIDTSFNNPLLASTYSSYPVGIFCLEIDSNGKIVISGSFNTINGVSRNCIARLNTDGSLDTSFDPGTGLASSSTFNGYAAYNVIKIQPDNKVLLFNYGGFYNGLPTTFLRINSDGSHDNFFQNNLVAAGSSNSSVNDIQIQSDGKILVFGSIYNNYNVTAYSYGIRRFNMDGSIDLGFYHPIATNFIDYNRTIWKGLIQEDGKIVIAGSFTRVDGITKNSMARLNSDGTLDSSFDIGSNTLGQGSPIFRSMILLPNEKTVISKQYTANDPTSNIVTFNTDGSIDTTFQPTSSNSGTSIETLALQPDGKIVFGGNFSSFGGVAKNRLGRIYGYNTLSISSFDQTSLHLYPNPVSSMLNVQVGHGDQVDKIVITDLAGKIILERVQSGNQVNVEQLASGIYIIQSFLGEKKFTSKFIKE